MPKVIDVPQRRAQLAQAVWRVIRRDGLERAVCTGTDSPATHLRVHSAPENAPGDALGVGCYPAADHLARRYREDR